MSRRKPATARPGEELTRGYDSMLCVDDKGAPTDKVKQFCPACGLPRDAELAKRVPCGACGALGTQAKAPQFDEFNERIPDEVIEQRNAERVERLQAGRERKRTAQQAIVEDHPTSDHALTREREAAKAIKLVQEARPKQEQPKPANLADLFLAAM